MSLLLTVFLIAFFTQLISWIGKSVLLEWAYRGYLRITRNSVNTRQRALKTEILNNKSELLKTSAQDQFAKWAKLRRSVDKGLAELEKLNAEDASQKSSFSSKFNIVIWILTSGVNIAVGWWYGRKAVFYLPERWMGPLTWWFSFPFAPAGSVSVGVWSFACKRVLLVLERVVKAVFFSPPVEEEPLPASEATPTTSTPTDEKKESTATPAASAPRRRKTTVTVESEED